MPALLIRNGVSSQEIRVLDTLRQWHRAILIEAFISISLCMTLLYSRRRTTRAILLLLVEIPHL
jgi:hypothetical protein